MERVFNFSAGPSGLPLPVLEKAAGEPNCVCSKESSCWSDGQRLMSLDLPMDPLREVYLRRIILRKVKPSDVCGAK